MTTTIGNHETRLIDRRCRCGTLLAESSPRCVWHPYGSAQYAADLLIYIASLRRTPRRTLLSRLVTFVSELKDRKGETMNEYLFEYIDNRDNHATKREPIRAVDSRDAFDAFRASHPAAPISNIWVEIFGAKHGSEA